GAGGAGGAACARQGEPPGGPPHTTPPKIVRVTPESGAVVPALKGDAVIEFDEVIDEMPGSRGGGGGGGGAAAITGLAHQIVLSPVDGEVRVSWHRSAIHVKPAEGWKPNRVYHLELLPGIVDLRRNIMKKGTTVIFSTGAPLPHAALAGTALQWVEQRVLTGGVIRAARSAPAARHRPSAGVRAPRHHARSGPRAVHERAIRLAASQGARAGRLVAARQGYDGAPGGPGSGSPAGARGRRATPPCPDRSRYRRRPRGHDEDSTAPEAAARAVRPARRPDGATTRAGQEVPDPRARRDQSERRRRGRGPRRPHRPRAEALPSGPRHHPRATRLHETPVSASSADPRS